jgi:glycosyltransferase involved in cell wall biosynthesis
MDVCEVRIPTCNRPELLERALKSLIGQEFGNWKAIVFDDNPIRENQVLINEFADTRIIYSPNKVRLGAAGNINQAFQTTPYVDGSYAFVLEDDNYLLPDFISNNITALNHYRVNIMLRNQLVEVYKGPNNTELTNLTTRGDWMEEKLYSPLELCAFLFFNEGISNGGLFWRTSAKSDLVVEDTSDVGLQENFRTLHIAEPILFRKKPAAVFTYMDKNITARRNNKNRIYGRGRQEIIRRLIKRYGKELISKAEVIATKTGRQHSLEAELLSSFYLRYRFHIPLIERTNIFFKSFLRYYLYSFK